MVSELLVHSKENDVFVTTLVSFLGSFHTFPSVIPSYVCLSFVLVCFSFCLPISKSLPPIEAIAMKLHVFGHHSNQFEELFRKDGDTEGGFNFNRSRVWLY